MDMDRERHATFFYHLSFSLIGTTDLIFVLLIQIGIEVALFDIIGWSYPFLATPQASLATSQAYIATTHPYLATRHTPP
jgi:hypothetical protein